MGKKRSLGKSKTLAGLFVDGKHLQGLHLSLTSDMFQARSEMDSNPPESRCDPVQHTHSLKAHGTLG